MRLTNPLWYLLALVIALGSTMAAVAVAASAFDPVRDARVAPITERVDAKGATLAVYTDIVQEDRDIACRGRYGKKDKGRIEIPDKGVEITAQGDGIRWTLIGLLEEGRDDLRIVCTPADRRVDNASYGYATVTGYTSKVDNGRGISSMGLAAGVALAGWVFWCRRSARKTAKAAENVVRQ